jgi:outer membrane protein OmpA-like peptidoglycan-associated protein
MKTIFTSTLLALLTVSMFGQSKKLKKADSYYNHLSYAYAIPLYEDLLGTRYENTVMKSNLAKSYYKLNETAKAEKLFAEIVQKPEADKENYFYYAQSLKQNGKYAESDQLMAKFNSLSGSDARGTSYMNHRDYKEKIEKAGDRFTIKNLDVNTAFSDFGGYPSGNEASVYFVSSRKDRAFVRNEWSWTKHRFLDLYKAKKNAADEISDPERLPRKVNTRYHEGPLCYSPDGKYVYFTRNNLGKGKQRRDQQGIQNLELYRANLDAEGHWTDEQVLPFNSKDYSVGHPSVSTDGKTLYFASTMPGGYGGADLYKMEIKSDGSFGNALNMGKEFNTEGQEMFPWMGADGNLYFSSDGLIGLGGLDIFVAMGSKNGAFGQIVNVGKPVNGQQDDFAFVMLGNGKTGYFSSNREGGKGDDDIYAFSMNRPFIKKTSVEGVVKDKKDGSPLSEAIVELKDASGKTLATAVTGSKGDYSFETEPEKDYSVFVSREKYFDNQASFTFKNLPVETSVLKQDMVMDENVGLALYALITDSKSTLPLDSVHLIIIDRATNEVILKTYTPKSGDAFKGIVNKKVGDKISYEVVMTKKGYFPKEVIFNYEIKTPGTVKIHEVLKGALEMDKEVADLKDMVEIRPIKFDYNKFNIRPDAAIELDKIITIMNKYPKMVIELAAHTDCRGLKAYNEKLSDKRAKSSAAYIQSKIVNPDRIYGKGYGENNILNGCTCEGAVKSDCTEEQHQENRRTEFKVISVGK